MGWLVFPQSNILFHQNMWRIQRIIPDMQNRNLLKFSWNWFLLKLCGIPSMGFARSYYKRIDCEIFPTFFFQISNLVTVLKFCGIMCSEIPFCTSMEFPCAFLQNSTSHIHRIPSLISKEFCTSIEFHGEEFWFAVLQYSEEYFYGSLLDWQNRISAVQTMKQNRNYKAN